MRNVSICERTPREHAIYEQIARESHLGFRQPPRLPPPPQWVTVKFYSHIYKIRQGSAPDMEGDVMLTKSGALDVRQVLNKWGLEECVAIDPMRWTPVYRTRENHLSPLAVQILSEISGCIMFVEPTASKSTTRKRALREATEMVAHSITAFFTLILMTILHLVVSFLARYTPFVHWSSEVKRAWRLEAASRAYFMNLYGRTMNITWGIVLFATATFWLYMTMEHIQLAPKQRAWNWARTGSFTLTH
ncbi:hypothetical protein E1B28_006385 [Marasmius oreades]|uniref:Uncharacterized protein n=1 Tax=Marasmius oreades TaxID=181124 RepID=A0A9P7S865_9AGAR|nr:uncharacterized protein E1B28_006385 [Marasmius oreades]KAG7095668.1 hypothetical protein E1B28_006385 [Marasmius oreades]